MAKQVGIILDSDGRPMEVVEGNISAGMLTFKRGGFFGMGGEEQQIEFDQNKCIPSKKGYKVAYYQYDNGSITQLTFKDIQEKSVSSEYDLNYRLGKATIDNMIPAIDDLQEKLKWLIIAVIFILAIVCIAMVLQLQSVSKNLLAPYANVTKLNNQLVNYLIKNQNYTDHLDNATLNYLRAYTNATRGLG